MKSIGSDSSSASFKSDVSGDFICFLAIDKQSKIMRLLSCRCDGRGECDTVGSAQRERKNRTKINLIELLIMFVWWNWRWTAINLLERVFYSLYLLAPLRFRGCILITEMIYCHRKDVHPLMCCILNGIYCKKLIIKCSGERHKCLVSSFFNYFFFSFLFVLPFSFHTKSIALRTEKNFN